MCTALARVGDAGATTDTTPPSIAQPPNLVIVGAPCGSVYCATVNYSLTVTDPDNTPDQITVVCNPPSGSTFNQGTATVNCYAQDPAGNTSHFYTTFYVSIGQPPPTFHNVPGPITVTATSASGAVVFFNLPTATSATGNPDSVSCGPWGSGATYPIGTTTETCTASDTYAVGPATASWTVTVLAPGSGGSSGSGSGGGSGGGGSSGGSSGGTGRDTTAPTIRPHPNIRVDATTSRGADVDYTVTATDTDDGTPQIRLSCLPASGARFALGPHAATKITTVTCRAEDPAGNQAAAMSFTVTVLGARDQLAALEREVVGSRSLLGRRENPLLLTLVRADRAFRMTDTAKADTHLSAFISQVDGLARPLARHTRTAWVAAAARIIALLA